MVDCPICERVESAVPPEGGWIYESERFRAFALPTMDVPGWLILQTTRHADGIAGLNDTEQQELGVVMAKLADGMIRLTGNPKVYMFGICERFSHFHMAIGSAPVTTPEELRGGPLLSRVILVDPSLRDRQKALSVAGELRQLLLEVPAHSDRR